MPADTLVLPGHTSEPVAFDGAPLAASLVEVRRRTPLLGQGEADFLETILARLPATPPNHQIVTSLNEAGQAPAGDPTELEAGANRCAVA